MEVLQNPFSFLVELSKIIAESRDPGKNLQNTVEFIADQFRTDVCSIYVLDNDKSRVTLSANVGLNPESVNRIQMDTGQGLTGMVLEQRSPVFVTNPTKHPRFEYFQDSGEERYSTFLGIPLIYHQDLLGVLVVQTEAEDALTREHIEIFQAIATQISALVAYSGLLNHLQPQAGSTTSERTEQNDDSTTTGRESDKGLIRGKPVSAGFGWGRAHFLKGNLGFDSVSYHPVKDTDAEIRRFLQSVEQSEQEIQTLSENNPDLVDSDMAILQAQTAILQDPNLHSRIKEGIKKGYNAEYSLKTAVEEYIELFNRAESLYLQERGKDIEDVGKMILSYLFNNEQSLEQDVDRDTVLVASDITPSELIKMNKKGIQALVLVHGGQTTHAVILARAFQIPTVIRATQVPDTAKNGDFLIVDGNSGIVFVNPSREIKSEYERLHKEQKELEDRLLPYAALPAETIEGHRLEIGANIALLSDTGLVLTHGADFVGLYRSEFPFLARNSFPSEQEQYNLYASILERVEGKSVTIRTLDVGGDKFLPYLDAPQEDNPALGWRSIRISLDMEDIFREQLRAILRAANQGKVRIMFPMITAASEVRNIRSILAEEMQNLEKRGESPGKLPEVGIMLEVPGTVKILHKLLPLLDFVSIGTNDMIQYTLAVDRNNPRVEPWSSPFHPAVIHILQESLDKCVDHAVPVTICGEAASIPAFAYLLLGMGFTNLSMNPTSIPSIKNTFKHVSSEQAKLDVDVVFGMEEAGEIRDYLEAGLQKAMAEASGN
ncbi:MAG: phosphoenolpyruvate--protein phosphotransferase [Thermodesulfobacteriota bacterium]